MKRVVISFGTRPEAIKLAPVYLALQQFEGIEPIVLLTGQHREQLEQSLALFKIKAVENLDLMSERQSLPELGGKILQQVAAKLARIDPNYLLIQGDTLTTFTVAWAAFLNRIPVGHVEAGLRSFNLEEPFPEEANRKLTSVVTDLDLAPTPLAKKNLIQEGKSPEKIIVTGQTGIDSILYAAKIGNLPQDLPNKPFVTVTIHRRENWPILDQLAQALARVATENSNFNFIYPVHLNPIVRENVFPILKRISNFYLIDPLEYSQMAALLARSELIITDSGGLQEEGAGLGVPVIVLRNVTERPEGLETGILRIAGTEPDKIFRMATDLLANTSERAKLKGLKNPYGDGSASHRVASAIAWRLGLSSRPADWNS